MAYEIDETTSLLARHVAALDDIYAKISHPGQDHRQSLRQGLGSSQSLGQGLGLATRQDRVVEPRMTDDHKTFSEFPRQRLHLDIDDSNNGAKINAANININTNTTASNHRMNDNRTVGALTSSGVPNEDNMALALREQIQVRASCLLPLPLLTRIDMN